MITKLLRPELRAHHPDLHERAATIWRRFIGTLLPDLVGGGIVLIGAEAQDSWAIAVGATLAAYGLVANGFTLSQLHETSKAFEVAEQVKVAAPQITEEMLPFVET